MGPPKFSFIARKDSNRRHTGSIFQAQRVVVQDKLCSKKLKTEAMMMVKINLLRSSKDI